MLSGYILDGTIVVGGFENYEPTMNSLLFDLIDAYVLQQYFDLAQHGTKENLMFVMGELSEGGDKPDLSIGEILGYGVVFGTGWVNDKTIKMKKCQLIITEGEYEN